MLDLDWLEKIAGSRWALEIILMMGCIMLAWTCRRLYRDKNALHLRVEESNARLVQLLEKIYERRIGDFRGAGGPGEKFLPGAPPAPPAPHA
jgi:hypothetical protein